MHRGPLVAALAALLASCALTHEPVDPESGDPSLFRWNLPDGFPTPPVPADNPMSAAKVALGRRLFYDTRLSGNNSFSCSSCHRQAAAFSDVKNVPVGSTGEAHTRNSMGLTNVAYQQTLGWAAPNTTTMELQALIPMFGDVPVELGLKGRESELLDRLRAVPEYQTLFPKSFPADAQAFSVLNVTRALAAFQRTIISGNSAFDRAQRGNRSAMSPAAQRGEVFFFGPTGRCGECHGGRLQSNAAFIPLAVGPPGVPPQLLQEFFNNGLYNIGGTGSYPARNGGLFETSGVAADMGRMKVPSLRNVALTFPYMHDGSLSTLEDVIEHYARGGRNVALGPNAGDGRLNPFKDGRLRGFALTPQLRTDLLAFLHSLTDSSVVTDLRFSNPVR